MGKEKPNLAHFDHPVSSEGVCVLGEGGRTNEQLWSSQSKVMDSLKSL